MHDLNRYGQMNHVKRAHMYSRGASYMHQRGVSLFVALIALVVMTLAGLALVRSIDTATLVAGNLAFKEAAVSIADRGTEAAINYLTGTATLANTDANLPAGCNPPDCQYYHEGQSSIENTKGVPAFNWGSTNIPSVEVSGYKYQFVIERLCKQGENRVIGPVAREEDSPYCFSNTREGGNSFGIYSSGSAPPLGAELEIVYRVTTKVSGPRNTETIVQTLLSR